GRVVRARPVANECVITRGRVVVSVVLYERAMTGGRVSVACCVETERTFTVGRVVVADCVVPERQITDGRVGAAACVANVRLKTDGRVVASACEADERVITLGGVGARQACVLANRSRLRRKRKVAKGKQNRCG